MAPVAGFAFEGTIASKAAAAYRRGDLFAANSWRRERRIAPPPFVRLTRFCQPPSPMLTVA